MAQLTVRLDDELAREVKAHAAALDRSVNHWIVQLLAAAVNPELEESDARRTRARLERAGLLARPPGRRRAAPRDRRRAARARKAAGAGTSLSSLVSDGRG
jgi:predicted transcriptional regulator